MKKKIFIFLLLVSLLIPEKIFANLEVSARAAILIEAESGRILYQKNIYEKLPMASTTKIMTAIIAIENGNLKDEVKITGDCVGIEGTSIYLKEGEKLLLIDLLKGMMLVSGNDAAYAIGKHIGGDIDGFSEMMNKKAKEIGCKNTNFKNPHGLPDDEHYTTAYDLCKIADYAMKNKDFRKIINTESCKLPYDNIPGGRSLKNKNKLLHLFDGANGIKTGYTKKAGRCFVFSAERNGMQLVGVVLNSYDIYGEASNLLEYGFNNYEYVKILEKGKYIGSISGKSKDEIIKIYNGENIFFPLKREEIEKGSIIIDLDEKIKIENKLEKVGKYKILIGEDEIYNRKLFGKEIKYKYDDKKDIIEKLKKIFIK